MQRYAVNSLNTEKEKCGKTLTSLEKHWEESYVFESWFSSFLKLHPIWSPIKKNWICWIHVVKTVCCCVLQWLTSVTVSLQEKGLRLLQLEVTSTLRVCCCATCYSVVACFFFFIKIDPNRNSPVELGRKGAPAENVYVCVVWMHLSTLRSHLAGYFPSSFLGQNQGD